MASPGFTRRLLTFATPLVLAAALLLSASLSGQSPQPQANPNSPGQLPADAQQRLDQLQSSLKSAIAARDARTAAQLFNQIGELWMRAGNLQNAQEAFSHAVQAAKMSQDVEQGLAALNGLGNVARAQGRTDDALQAFQRAVDVATTRGVSGAGKADALNGLALTYADSKQPGKALEAANQALAIRQSMGDHAGEAVILAEIATGYNAAGNKAKALDYAKQAQDAFQAAGDQRGVASALAGAGDIYASMGDAQKALALYNQALAIARQLNFPRILATTHVKIGLVEYRMGDYRKALDDYTPALPIFQRLNMGNATGLALSDIGMAWSGLGEKEKAIGFLNQALPILRNSGDRKGEAVVLNNLGRVYQDLGDRQKALEYYNQALPILTAQNDLADEDIALNNMGALYVEAGDKQKAIEVLNQAVSLQSGLSNHRGEALARVSLGMAYHKMGDDQKALDSVHQGIEILRQVGDRANLARAYTALAKIYGDKGDLPQALANLNQALPLARALNDPLLESPVLYGMMLVNKSRPALAIFYGKQAVNLLQQVRSNIQGTEKSLQTTFVGSKAVFYHDLADLLIAQGRLPEAQQVLDLLKQQEYSDYVRGAETSALSPLTLTAAEQKAEQDYERSTGQLVAAGQRWAELKNTTDRTAQQETQFKQLSDQLDAASKALNDYYARLYVLFGNNSAANKQVADVKGDVSALEDQISESPHTVALYTMVTGDHYRVIVITASATVAREFAITEQDLNKKVSDFEQVLRKPSSNPRPLARELYSILVAPVQADLDQAGAQTLVWSLDGVLRYLPMAALYDGKQYLVEKYATVTITPASIAHLGEKPDVTNLSVAAMGIARQVEQALPALPAVAGELDDVAKDPKVQGANGVLPGTILLDGEFTEKAMETQLGGKHGVVHIASHFVFKPGDDSQSYLLLAGDGPGHDGFHLTVADFRDNRNLTLRHTELLTLSACETGMSGSASNGREVDGLGTTAQLKGARAVISSLWPVNDSSTGELMADFYKRWAGGAGKVSKVEALRAAQLDLLQGKVTPKAGPGSRGVIAESTAPSAASGYAHPFYWAPFVLMGNWR